MREDNLSFFTNHEKRINRMVCFIYSLLCLIPIFVFINVFLGYYNYPLKMAGLSVVLSVCVIFLLYLLNKSKFCTRAIKYVAVLALQCLVFLYFLDINIQISVLRMLSVYFSLLYFDPLLTIFACVVSFLSVILSTIYTAPQAVEVLWRGISSNQYILTTGSGIIIEIISASILFISLSFLARKMMLSLHQRNEKIYLMQNQIVYSFADIIESRDGTTGEHVKRTSQVVSLISDYIYKNQNLFNYNLTKHDFELITMAAPLHDIGKMKVPDIILSKPGKLEPDEYEVIKTHSLEGAKIIDKIMPKIGDAEYIKYAREMALNHHEKWNGEGYPNGLKEQEIPISARIMAVADVFDALCSKRSYKKPFTIDQAYSIMEESRGIHFEPILVDVIIALRPKLEQIYANC